MTFGTASPPTPSARNRMAYVLLWAALGLMIGGVTLPAISVSSFWIYEETYSILGGILAMAERGEVLLAGFVFAVSVLFPTAKIVLGLLALRRLHRPDAKLA
ncbi:MAG: paraquat-inducible protein A, partial [Pseudomonadota bacterium]